jgi:hypothetical protein
MAFLQCLLWSFSFLHNNTDQDFNNFQESCMLQEWRDLIMDHTKFSWSHELAPKLLFPTQKTHKKNG